jgi:RHS repeat-associated protein
MSSLYAQYPQKSWELNSAESGNRGYIARDYILLKPGFSYTAENGKSFSARINEKLLLPAEYQTTSQLPDPDVIDMSLPVGTVMGSANVTPSGAAVYQISIQIPNGVNGMQPEISIVYNSQSGNGLLGYGWNLAAFSVISRTGKNHYYDGNGLAAAPNLTSSDNLALDGQRLMLIDGTNLSIGATYGTETETYSEITCKTINGFTAFEIKSADGHVMEYGSTADSYIEVQGSSTPVCWLLSKVTDKNGNYITYSYEENYSTGEFWLRSIDYTGNTIANTGHTNKVKFFYETRSDIQKSYIAGKQLVSSVILKKIKISVNGLENKEYVFNYFYDGIYSKLTEIIEYGNDNHFNSTKVNWGDRSATASKEATEYVSYLYSNKESIIDYADFNGDGKIDFITYPKKDSYSPIDSATLFLAYSYNGRVNFAKKCKISLGYDFRGFLYGDFNSSSSYHTEYNGNGYTDIVRINRTEIDFEFKIFFFHGDSFSDGLTFYSLSSEALAGDFNGDGKFEILTKDGCKVYNQNAACIASGGGITWGVKYVPYYPNNKYTFDFNGNGKTDVLVIDDYGYRIYELSGSGSSSGFILLNSGNLFKNSDAFLFGDFNGDGKSDILCHRPINNGAQQKNYVFYSTGTAFIETSLSIQINGRGFTGDFNRDGKTDIAFCSSVTGYVLPLIVGLSNGTSFDFTSFSSDLITSSLSSMDPSTDNRRYFDLADIDGDGRSEMIFTGYATNALIIKTFSDNQNLLVRNIVDGLGNITSFNYAAISEENANYSETATTAPLYPVVRNKIPLIVVNSLLQSAGNGMYSSYTYSYKNLRMHKQGKGFICFEEIRVTDSDKQQKTITKYGYETPNHHQYYYPYIVKQSVLTLSNDTVSTVTFTNNCLTMGTKRYFPYLSSQTQTNHLTGDVLTTTFSDWEYANPKTIVKNYGGGISETTSIVYQNTINNNVYITGLPQTVETVKAKGEQSWKDKVVTEYNAQFLPSKITTYTNDGSKKTGSRSFTYDTFGNGLTDTARNYNSTHPLVTKRSFSPDGRFLMKETDLIGLSVNYQYDPRGRLQSVTDHKNNQIYFEYDAFGRQTKQINPDGTETSSILSWESAFENWELIPDDASYSITQTATGKPTLKMIYDATGREIRKFESRFDGSLLKIDKRYDSRGRLWKESMPYKTLNASLWNIYAYDSYNRLISITHASGKVDSWVYNGNSVTTIKEGISSTKTFDSAGQVISVEDGGGTITYALRPDGQPSSITAFGNSITSFGYDDYGRQISINDPSAGLQTYHYNAAGNPDTITNANGKKTVMQYDVYNRLISKKFPEFSTSYTYHPTDGVLANVTSTNGTSKIFTYDNLGRISAEKENAPDSKWLQKTFSYNGGNIQSIDYTAHSGNIATENYYYANGYLSQIKLNGQTTIWALDAENDLGLPTIATTGSITRTYEYDTYGLPTRRKASNQVGSFLYYAYNFDRSTGNLNYRDDIKYSTMEDFYYDDMNRLRGVLLHYTYYPITYSNNGNLTDNALSGTFQYNNSTKPFAVSGATPYGNAIPQRDQTITYTSFMRPSIINENGYKAVFTYNNDADRVKMQVTNNSSAVLTRYYLSNYETDVTPESTIQRLYLGGDAYTAPAVFIKNGTGAWSVYYICRDYLGSITHITNANGVVQQERNYDAWGRLRDPVTQEFFDTDCDPALLLGRGYIGHEHLPWFGLINMNARLYDPVLGRFLSPDPFVQAPDFTQNFNRYSYALNNPLKYTDPDGEVWWLIPVAVTAAFAVGNTVAHAMRGDINGFGDGLKYFAQGAITGFALGCAWQFAPLIPIIGQGIQTAMTAYSYGQAGFGILGTAAGAFNDGWKGVENGAKTFLGNFYMDENNWLGGMAQGFLRHTWEIPQSLIGQSYTQVRNISGNVDRVDYLGGATFATNENSDKRNGISIGNYININIRDEITGNFQDRVLSDPLFMHEYGHTIDSRAFGLSYLFAIGIPSIISAAGGGDHSKYWTERRANRRAKSYFGKYYCIDWNTAISPYYTGVFEDNYPTY